MHDWERPGRRTVAVTDADRLWGQTRAFQRKVERALEVIAASVPPVGVAFSGGKDSTVALHLTRRVFPDAAAGFYDSGAELRQTYEFIARTPNVQIIPAEGGGLIELCRQNGYWGREPLSDHPHRVNFDAALVWKPAERFIRQNGLATVVLGLRAGESFARLMNASRNGLRYITDSMRKRLGYYIYHLCPLQWWTEDDVWAYIAVNGLDFNEAYDRMTELGIPRKAQRIGPVMGTDAASLGRLVWLRMIDPELWNRLSGEFPLLRKYG